MIDLHCHILPGLDDGAQTMVEALEMARIAVADGITDIVATPHTHDGIYKNLSKEVLKAVDEFQSVLDRKGIPLRVHPGAEVHIHVEFLRNIFSFNVLTVNQCRYVLLELPVQTIPRFTEKLIYELLENGLVPMIAHPERNAVIRENFDLLADWIREGAIAQLTAGSLMGWMGERTKAVAEYMVKHRLVQVIASDAHNTVRRRPELKTAYELISHITSREEERMFRINAEAVFWGEDCERLEPTIDRNKKWISF
ncbi:tyrosine-protein phosphatase [Lihuaxuella thermophila]|uniref:Tyrosine-protein phosphatase n=1 Tax=Lihuaxuella thermophila TaxID=1173111 RepID=A0A1H8CF36_9BACL|nr:CpsB/CapC family capsule biosynthesis tyrosine phosphatase [Lihuaxuella thermophila]SEM93610.1 protein-tyrosine phosphatase [Lihuaxuella thermophila]